MWAYKFVNNKQSIRAITNKTISSDVQSKHEVSDEHIKSEDIFMETLDRMEENGK